MKRTIVVITVLFILIFSCTQQQDQNHSIINAPKIVQVEGYIIPKDSITIAKTITVGSPKVVKAAPPKNTPTNTNIN